MTTRFVLKTLLAAGTAVALGACSQTPTAGPSPQPPASTTASATATPSSSRLLDHVGWECVPGAEVTGGTIALHGGSTAQFSLVASEARLMPPDAFDIEATFEVPTSSGEASVSFVNSLPAADPRSWLARPTRVSLGLAAGRPQVRVWDGDPNPAFQYTAPKMPSTRSVTLRLRKDASGLTFSSDGVEVGRTRSLGSLTQGPVYLAATVGPQASAVLSALTVTDTAGAPVRIDTDPLALGSSTAPVSLRDALTAQGRLLGAGGVDIRDLRWNPTYAATTARAFNSLAPAFAFTWKSTEPTRGGYTFCDADQSVRFAREHGMQVDAKFLVWGDSDLPDWVRNGSFTRDQLAEVLHQHIATVAGRFRGHIDLWEVGNEVLNYDYHASPARRETIWQRTIGPDYLDMAFRWAREADPHAVLILNETGAEGTDAKADAFYKLVAEMRGRGVPIDGVGLQMHIWLRGSGGDRGTPSAAQVAANIRRFNDLGLRVYITEMNVPITPPVTSEKLAAQAANYQAIISACLAAPNCRGITTWGVDDGHSPLDDGRFGNTLAAPLLLDAQFQPKPAFNAALESARR